LVLRREMILHQGDWVLAYTGASPQPLAQIPIMRVNDGGVFIDPGDVATVTLPVTNRGDASRRRPASC
jgi:hypothetical protein